MYSATDVNIVNMALALVGSPYDQVTAVDGTDTTKWGQWAGLFFQQTRNAELRINEWKFAVKRAPLGPVTTVTNNTGYWYAYTIPADCLFTCFLYAILPQWVFLYPRKYLHIVRTPYIVEDQYYTDLDRDGVDGPQLCVRAGDPHRKQDAPRGDSEPHTIGDLLSLHPGVRRASGTGERQGRSGQGG